MLWTLIKSIMRWFGIFCMMLAAMLAFLLLKDGDLGMGQLVFFGIIFLFGLGLKKLFKEKDTDRTLSDAIIEKANGAGKQKSRRPRENEAQKWLNGYKASLAEETRIYQSNQREHDRLYDEARNLEERARYGSAWERKNLKDQARELRRKADRL
jgi:hypothetical protein